MSHCKRLVQDDNNISCFCDTLSVDNKMKTQKLQLTVKYNQHKIYFYQSFLFIDCTICAFESGSDSNELETFSFHNHWTSFIVLSSRNCKIVKGGERRQNRTANPRGVRLRLENVGKRLGIVKVLHVGDKVLLDALAQAGKERRAAGEQEAAVAQKAVERLRVASRAHRVAKRVEERRKARLHAHQRRREKRLGAAKALAAERDALAVGQLVRLGERGWLGLCALQRCAVVERDTAELLFDVARQLALQRRRKAEAARREQLGHPLGEVLAADADAAHAAAQRKAFVDWQQARGAAAGVEHAAERAAGGVEREHALARERERRHLQRLEEHFGRALALLVRIERRLAQQHRLRVGRLPQLVEERVPPHTLHRIKVGHLAFVADRPAQRQQLALCLRLVSNVRFFQQHATACCARCCLFLLRSSSNHLTSGNALERDFRRMKVSVVLLVIVGSK